jgi:hypothetical protein
MKKNDLFPLLQIGIIIITLFILVYLYKYCLKEGFESKTDFSNSFCKEYQGKSDELEKACDKLTKKSCVSSPCCVFKNNERCVAGNQSGPIFKTDTDGNKMAINQYIFQKTCYGKDCKTQ